MKRMRTRSRKSELGERGAVLWLGGEEGRIVAPGPAVAEWCCLGRPGLLPTEHSPRQGRRVGACSCQQFLVHSVLL